MFRTADPSRRTPVWLQSHTKENIIWQFAMSVVLFVGMEARDRYIEKKAQKAIDQK